MCLNFVVGFLIITNFRPDDDALCVVDLLGVEHSHPAARRAPASYPATVQLWVEVRTL